MYAEFDSTAAQPTPVIGWHDGLTPAALLVPSANLLPLTQTEWDNRLATPYVQNGILVAAPLPTAAQLLAQAQAVQRGMLYQDYLAANAANISFTDAGGVTDTYQADPASVTELNNCLSAYRASGTVPAGFYWRSFTNKNNPFVYADLVGLSVALANRGFANFAHLQTQNASVMAATTVTAVQAVVW